MIGISYTESRETQGTSRSMRILNGLIDGTGRALYTTCFDGGA